MRHANFHYQSTVGGLLPPKIRELVSSEEYGKTFSNDLNGLSAIQLFVASAP
jgi:hypothetical protein